MPNRLLDPGLEVHLAEAEADIIRCWPVMAQLRPHIQSPAELVERVQRQRAEGYRLAFLEVGERVVACAGFRICEMLARGRNLYVDDLVTADAERSKGYGEVMLDWLVARAQAEGCDSLHLDSGTQRMAAHRFYVRYGLDIVSFHFALRLR